MTRTLSKSPLNFINMSIEFDTNGEIRRPSNMRRTAAIAAAIMLVAAGASLAAIKLGLIGGETGPESPDAIPAEPAVQKRLPGEQPTSTTTKTVVTHLEPGKLPAGLPSDFPLDPNGETILNEVRTLERGTKQAQISFVTRLGVQDVFKGYKDYLKATKWWMGSVDQENASLKSLTASKEAKVITIVVQSADDGRTKVDVILTDHGVSAAAGGSR